MVLLYQLLECRRGEYSYSNVIQLINDCIRQNRRTFNSSRQRRSASLHANPTTVAPRPFSHGNSVLISCIDLRTIPEKIEDLRQEMLESAVIYTPSFPCDLLLHFPSSSQKKILIISSSCKST